MRTAQGRRDREERVSNVPCSTQPTNQEINNNDSKITTMYFEKQFSQP